MALKWKFDCGFVCILYASQSLSLLSVSLSVCACTQIYKIMSSKRSILCVGCIFLCTIYLVGEFRNSIGFIWNCNCVIAIHAHAQTLNIGTALKYGAHIPSSNNFGMYVNIHTHFFTYEPVRINFVLIGWICKANSNILCIIWHSTKVHGINETLKNSERSNRKTSGGE